MKDKAEEAFEVWMVSRDSNRLQSCQNPQSMFIAGYHSRDEEVERLKLKPQGLEGLLSTPEIVSLREYQRREKEIRDNELREAERKAFEVGREQTWSTWGEHPLPDQALWINKYETFEDYERERGKV